MRPSASVKPRLATTVRRARGDAASTGHARWRAGRTRRRGRAVEQGGGGLMSLDLASPGWPRSAAACRPKPVDLGQLVAHHPALGVGIVVEPVGRGCPAVRRRSVRWRTPGRRSRTCPRTPGCGRPVRLSRRSPAAVTPRLLAGRRRLCAAETEAPDAWVAVQGGVDLGIGQLGEHPVGPVEQRRRRPRNGAPPPPVAPRSSMSTPRTAGACVAARTAALKPSSPIAGWSSQLWQLVEPAEPRRRDGIGVGDADR